MAEAPGSRQAGIVGVFGRAAATYDRVGPRFFAHFGERLVEEARVPEGARVLDVATGRGAVLFPAARRVGPRGRVVGIDLAEEMVRALDADLRREGRSNVSVRRMDAEALDFAEASFDLLFCGHGLWFFPRPRRALEEAFRVLAPGGRVALSTWDRDGAYVSWLRRELPACIPGREDDAGRAEPCLFDTPGLLEAALAEAGFAEVGVRRESAEFVYVGDDEWWESLWSHGTRAPLERVAPVLLGDVRAEALRRIRPLRRPDGIHTPFDALFAFGTKPVDAASPLRPSDEAAGVPGG